MQSLQLLRDFGERGPEAHQDRASEGQGVSMQHLRDEICSKERSDKAREKGARGYMNQAIQYNLFSDTDLVTTQNIVQQKIRKYS